MSLEFVERLYADFVSNPDSVSPDWRKYFREMNDGASKVHLAAPLVAPMPVPAGSAGKPRVSVGAVLQHRVDQLIRNYRVRGHMIAQIDPLGKPTPRVPELEPEYYGFTEEDLDRSFSSEDGPGGAALTLRTLLKKMQNTYCRSIGVQFMHIDDLYVREWLQERMEASENHVKLTRREQVRILTRLTDAVLFEEFVQKKFVGAKSFSLEGAESLIPLLELAIEKAGEAGVAEVVLGMAHRGRLNVLANIIGKNPRQIFREFADADPSQHLYGGDVKYHLGHSHDWKTVSGKKIHLSLCFNPSHLEYVNPVAMGRMRAKQDKVNDVDRSRGMVLLIHGDAAFAGEGVVQETLNLSELSGYTTGGTLHVILNNQIGFVTVPADARSSTYATDVARMLQAPIFHVNGEDPEAVAQVVRLSMDFRSTFKRDVFIDMYCYRRRGHNESDEPSFTQPLMYKAIEQRKSVREGYLDHVLKLGEITREEAEEIEWARRTALDRELAVAQSRSQTMMARSGQWARYSGGPDKSAPDVDTAIEHTQAASLLEQLTKLPPDFHPHVKLVRLLDQRRQMAQGQRALDWSAGEALAFASLASEGTRIRLTGQDSTRGTFSQRHALLHDFETGQTYLPLQHLSPKQGPVEIYNSPLSESGVLGFEYGYSLDCPAGLVLWEAQFGDFCNAAQVIIDQFIASAEEKWNRFSSLVLLLPHGFEGMGPEHSSARLERFLSLCANDNMQVVYPTTPAQYFHVLRRQIVRRWRKPLVVMTPKSLLRHVDAVSNLDEFARGRFQRVIGDSSANPGEVDRILLCSGKIYYELAAARKNLNAANVAIVRLEQLYPLSEEQLSAALKPYRENTPVVWVQEEPENMGTWRYLRVNYPQTILGYPFTGVYRPTSASPATGSSSSHKWEQERLIEQAFGVKSKSRAETSQPVAK